MKTETLILFVVSYIASVNTKPAFRVVVKGKGEPILLFPDFSCTRVMCGNPSG